jgi:hypothetical protein
MGCGSWAAMSWKPANPRPSNDTEFWFHNVHYANSAAGSPGPPFRHLRKMPDAFDSPKPQRILDFLPHWLRKHPSVTGIQ